MSTIPPRDVTPIAGWSVAAMFFFYAWVLRVSPSVMIEEMMRDLAIGAALLGQLSAAYFYGYAGMQIPVGMLLDRFGPRRLLTAAAAVCALGCLLFAAGTLASATLGRLLIGGGAAFSLVGAMAIAAQGLPARRFALLSGLAMMAGMAGGVAGQAPVGLLVEATDWKTVSLLGGGGALIIATAAWLLVRDRHRGKGSLAEVLGGLARVARNRETWLNAMAGLAATCPLLGFAALWGVPFLESTYRVDREVAASLTSLTFVGLGVGAPLIGWWSDRLGRRKSPMLLALSAELAAFAILVYVPDLPLALVGLLCFVVGLGCSSQICNYALAREHNAPELSATTIGLVNGVVTSTGALFQPLIGWVLDLAWDGTLADGARIYAAADYRLGFAALLAGGAIGYACALLVREPSG